MMIAVAGPRRAPTDDSPSHRRGTLKGVPPSNHQQVTFQSLLSDLKVTFSRKPLLAYPFCGTADDRGLAPRSAPRRDFGVVFASEVPGFYSNVVLVILAYRQYQYQQYQSSITDISYIYIYIYIYCISISSISQICIILVYLVYCSQAQQPTFLRQIPRPQ